MMTVNNTGIVLYRYLQALSVEVSRGTVHRLLDTPAGNSLRGISDTWMRSHKERVLNFHLQKTILHKWMPHSSPCCK